MTLETDHESATNGAPHQIIRASAGSGKTYQLASRYLGLLRAGEQPQHILATTFTRKAAGEILGRVLARLAKAAIDPREASQLSEDFKSHPHLRKDRRQRVSVDDCRALLAMLSASLHRVSISTLDSFFNRVVGIFRHELAIPLGASIVAPDDPLVKQLRFEAIDAVLAEHTPEVLLDLLQRLHHDQTQRSVSGAIERIVEDLFETYRQSPDEALWTRIEVPDAPPESVVRAAASQLPTLAEDMPVTRSGKPAQHWPGALAKMVDAVAAEDWIGFLGITLVQKVADGEAVFSRQEIPDRWRELITPFILEARARVLHAERERGRATFQLIESFARHFDELRQRHRVLLFSDLPERLARYLPSLGAEVLDDLYFRLDASLTHLMLDEFQDTSPTQWSVLAPLAREIAGHADFSRSFFCVGDTKQAIYGWRGGCAELFDKIEADLQFPPESYGVLAKSWRSSRVVLDVVNEVFSHLTNSPAMSDHGELAEMFEAGYEQHEAARDLTGHVVMRSTVSEDNAPDSDQDALDMDTDEQGGAIRISGHDEYVANYVVELAARYRGASIGVLVRKNATADAILSLLHSLGQQASGEGGIVIHSDPAVSAILAALTLADHPSHSAAAFEVVNSPLGEVIGLRSVHPAACGEVGRDIREKLLAEGYVSTLTAWARALAPACDAMNVRRLTQLVELAEQFEPSVTLRPTYFVRYVQEATVEDPAATAIRVMTVHKSKGLEFDIVVLPELESKMDLVMAGAVCVLRAHETQPPVAVYRGTKAEVRALFQPMQVAYEQEQRRRMSDSLCGLYVAMTRARRALHMLPRPLKSTSSGAPGTKGWSNSSAATLLRHALGPGEPDFTSDTVLFEAGNEDWMPGEAVELQPAQPPRTVDLSGVLREAETGGSQRALAVVSPSSLESGVEVRVAQLLSLAGGAGMRRGSVLHRWFEQIEWWDADHPPVPTDPDWFDAVRQDFPNLTEEDLSDLWRDFERQLSHKAVSDALIWPQTREGESVELWREQPFVVRLDDQLMRGVFDRVVLVRDADGEVAAAHIIDFKTDAVAGEGAMLEDRVSFYAPQVRAYKRSLATLLAGDVKENRAALSRRITASLLFVEAGVARVV